MFRRRTRLRLTKNVKKPVEETEDDKFDRLIAMGYKESDIKVALLRNDNNYKLALDTLRQEKRHISRGKLKNQAIKQMVSMGIDETEAFKAAEESNGDLGKAIERISKKKRESSGFLESKRSVFSAERRQSRNEEPLDKLMTLGYERGEAVEALREHFGELDKALEALQRKTVGELVQLGFKAGTVKAALKVASGNVGLTVDILKVNLTTETSHHYTDPALLEYLQSKGYSKTDSAEALKAAGGEMKIAMFYLKHPELLFIDSDSEI